jgi:radical SAM protein with 4Fe4S-binding SPASM domain
MSGSMRLRKLPPRLDVPCKNLFNFAVRHDGRVRLCGCRLTTNDNDDLVVGNIKEKTLTEISKGDEAWGIIKGFYEGKRPHTCLECTFYQPIEPPKLVRNSAREVQKGWRVLPTRTKLRAQSWKSFCHRRRRFYRQQSR